MNEFIKKLIEKLEGKKKYFQTLYECEGKTKEDANLNKATQLAFDDAIEIINQIAEEYNNESVNGDLISRSALKEEYDKLPIQATAEVKCDDGVYRNRPLVDLALVCKMIENAPTAYNDGWIPVSSGKLPDESMRTDDCGLVTVETTEILESGKRFTFIEDYSLNTKEFLSPYKVIAWRNRPEPYQPKGE